MYHMWKLARSSTIHRPQWIRVCLSFWIRLCLFIYLLDCMHVSKFYQFSPHPPLSPLVWNSKKFAVLNKKLSFPEWFPTIHGHVTTGALHGNGGWHAPPGVTSERRLARSTRRYIGTALRGVSVFTFISVVCCLYVTFLLPLQPHTIAQNWSGPIKLGPTCLIILLIFSSTF